MKMRLRQIQIHKEPKKEDLIQGLVLEGIKNSKQKVTKGETTPLL